MAKQFTVKARFEADTSNADRNLTRTQRTFQRFADGIRKSALIVTAAVAGIVAAFREVERTSNLATQTEALKRSLAEQGVAIQDYIGNLTELSDAQLSTAQIIQASNKAIALGIPVDAIGQLVEVARAASIQLGTSLPQAFDDIVTGIGRASPLILDNLGITVKLGEAQQNLADELGKTTEELTAQEKSQAILNEVLRVGTDRVEDFGDAQTELARGTAQARASLANFRDGLGRFVTFLSVVVLERLNEAKKDFLEFTTAILDGARTIAQVGEQLPFVSNRFRVLGTAIQIAAGQVRLWTEEAKAADERLDSTRNALFKQLLGWEETANAIETVAKKKREEFTPAAEEATEQIEEETTELLSLEEALSSVRAETEEATRAQVEFRQEVAATTAEVQRSQNVLGGTSEFATISGGTFTTFTADATIDPITGRVVRGAAARAIVAGRG